MNETTDTVEILHVDDDPDLCSLAVSFLEREDERFTVTTATRADDGLAVLEKWREKLHGFSRGMNP